MILKTKYIQEQEVCIEIATYSNHRPAIQIFSLDGMPLIKATVNVPEADIYENEVLIKNYSENEGILEELQRLNVIGKTEGIVNSGFVQLPVCVLNPESEWLTE